MLTTNLVLIGPSGGGKSTLVKLLGDALDAPYLDLDDIRVKYYGEIGYDHQHAQTLSTDEMVAYWKPFEIYSVERLFQDHPSGHVIAFGAGQSVYDNEEFAGRVQQALEPHIVVLLLPSPDIEESMQLLAERLRPIVPEEVVDTIAEMNRYFLEHPANRTLSDHTVYTKDRSPEEIRDEILSRL